ncbi:MAG: HU family DNA-binding protein [Patescibacteria group bacterium]|nr:HU family DNA-binding protein [Patescibacteria group bacterium]MDE2438196.1 HU family DNA-binding protein [Patescibacteria group bacterium]
MSKEGLVEAVQKVAEMSKSQAQEIVNTVFETITQTLKNGEEVAVTGFGTFRVSKRAARMATNPKTGEKINVPAKIVPKFKPGKGLKDAVA